MRIIKIFIGVVFVSVFLISSLSAYADDSVETAFASDIDCASLNSERETIKQELETKLPEMEKDNIIPESAQKKIYRYEDIANFADQCVRDFPEFEDLARSICAMYFYTKPPGEFEKYALPLCEKMMLHKDVKYPGYFFLDIMMFYMKDGNPHRNYQKAVYYIDKFVESHPDSYGFLSFKAALLRRGGYGLEKDDAAAFQIVEKLAIASQGKSTAKMKCELSLYYRHGIGTTVNEQESDKWLAEYRKNEPDEECTFIDHRFFFGEGPSYGLMGEVLDALDKNEKQKIDK